MNQISNQANSPPLPEPAGSINPRGYEADMIREAYEAADKALIKIGRLLRTTHAGEFMWSADHKTAISGLRVIVSKLRDDVPYYNAKPSGGGE